MKKPLMKTDKRRGKQRAKRRKEEHVSGRATHPFALTPIKNDSLACFAATSLYFHAVAAQTVRLSRMDVPIITALRREHLNLTNWPAQESFRELGKHVPSSQTRPRQMFFLWAQRRICLSAALSDVSAPENSVNPPFIFSLVCFFQTKKTGVLFVRLCERLPL